MKVLLDTNVLVSAFATRGLCADVLRLVLTEHEMVVAYLNRGSLRFEALHSSGTTYENPVIVDVDRDDNAEIIIASNNFRVPGEAGIRVYALRPPIDASDGLPERMMPLGPASLPMISSTRRPLGSSMIRSPAALDLNL